MSVAPIKLAGLVSDLKGDSLQRANGVQSHTETSGSASTLGGLLADVKESTPTAGPAAFTPPATRHRFRQLLKHRITIASICLLAVGLAAMLGWTNFNPARGFLAKFSSASPYEVTNEESETSDHAYSAVVQELRRYVRGLKFGKFVFDQRLSGEQAAAQLGFSRLFASGYQEVVLSARKRQRTNASSFAAIISEFERIRTEEQTIDQLLSKKERHATAIAYLRALQNGDVMFPVPGELAPVPQVLLVQLIAAYPKVSFDINDPVFAMIYRETRRFAQLRARQNRELWAQEIISKFRSLILESAQNGGPNVRDNECTEGSTLAAVTSIARACPRLTLTANTRRTLEAVAAQSDAAKCLEKVSVNMMSGFDSMPADQRAEVCDVLEKRVKAGSIPALDEAH